MDYAAFAERLAHFSSRSITEFQFDQLSHYVRLLLKWNQHYNLIGKSTETEVWERHIEESLWAASYISQPAGVLDIGSGAGIPGLPMAVMYPSLVVLCEPLGKRINFLKTVMRETGIDFQLISERIQVISEFQGNYFTSRAVAKVTELLSWTQHLWHKDSQFLFLKGRHCLDEVHEASQWFHFDFKIHQHEWFGDRSILHIEGVHAKNNSHR